MSSDAPDPADGPSSQAEQPQDGKPHSEPPPAETAAEPAGVAEKAAGQGRWARASRWTAGVVVLLLAAVLGGVAVIATYVRNEVLDTNTLRGDGRTARRQPDDPDRDR